MVCSDLSLPQQIVQVAHAAEECGIYWGTKDSEPNFMVICSCPDEASLLKEAARHPPGSLRIIREPDLRNRATAMTSAPLAGTDRKPFRRWRLWGSTPESRDQARVRASMDDLERELNRNIAARPSRPIRSGDVARRDIGAPHASMGGANPSVPTTSAGLTSGDSPGSTPGACAISTPCSSVSERPLFKGLVGGSIPSTEPIHAGLAQQEHRGPQDCGGQGFDASAPRHSALIA